MNGLLLLQALSPITHGAETAGNSQLIRRESVATPLGVRSVPTITGNSLRHRLIREPIADDLCAGWQVTKEQLRWLFNGGALDGKAPNVDVRRMEECFRLLPHTELLGCSLPDVIVTGKLDMGIAWLCCAETTGIITASLPAAFAGDLPLLTPSHEYLSRIQYYRHDAARQRIGNLLESDRDGADYAGMPHGGEHVIPGALFLCAFHAHGASDLAASALLYALQRWCTMGATVGGQSSRGHGVVQPYLWTDREVSADLYRQHLADHTDEIRAFVSKLYAKGEK
jgi:hypothetical protein